MTHVLFIQNGECDGPGLLVPALAARGVMLQTLHVWDGAPVPQELDSFAGLIIGGGAQSAYKTDRYPYLSRELELIRTARALGRPVFGICLGAQLMAAAFGGEVFAAEQKEIGLFPIHFAPEAASDPLWRDLPTSLTPAHWHGDTFTLPRDATLLASSALTTNQLFRIGNLHHGLQFHLEFDVPTLAEMINSDAEWLRLNGVELARFLADAERFLPAAELVARQVFSRWAALLLAKRQSKRP